MASHTHNPDLLEPRIINRVPRHLTKSPPATSCGEHHLSSRNQLNQPLPSPPGPSHIWGRGRRGAEDWYWAGRMFKLLWSPGPGIDSKETIPPAYVAWARIFKLLRGPRTDSREPIPLGCVAWRASPTTFSYSVPSPRRLFKNSSTFRPVRQPYSYSVPNLHRLF